MGNLLSRDVAHCYCHQLIFTVVWIFADNALDLYQTSFAFNNFDYGHFLIFADNALDLNQTSFAFNNLDYGHFYLKLHRTSNSFSTKFSIYIKDGCSCTQKIN